MHFLYYCCISHIFKNKQIVYLNYLLQDKFLLPLFSFTFTGSMNNLVSSSLVRSAVPNSDLAPSAGICIHFQLKAATHLSRKHVHGSCVHLYVEADVSSALSDLKKTKFSKGIARHQQVIHH